MLWQECTLYSQPETTRKYMNGKQKQELRHLEKQIVKTAHYVVGHGLVKPMFSWNDSTREELAKELKERQRLLNEMFLCTEEDVANFRKVNDRLYEMTKKMHEKALSLYRAILQSGYDPEFDDDIMIEGTLKYVFNDAWESVILSGEEKRNMYKKPTNVYGSDFPSMLDILSEYHDFSFEPECAHCSTSFELFHKQEMDAKDLGLDYFLDDGQSWAEGCLNRKEFEDICICYAVHDICDHKFYSIPDLLRMNDFWCEVKVTHQLLSDRDGKRFNCFKPREDC